MLLIVLLCSANRIYFTLLLSYMTSQFWLDYFGSIDLTSSALCWPASRINVIIWIFVNKGRTQSGIVGEFNRNTARRAKNFFGLLTFYGKNLVRILSVHLMPFTAIIVYYQNVLDVLSVSLVSSFRNLVQPSALRVRQTLERTGVTLLVLGPLVTGSGQPGLNNIFLFAAVS